MNQKPVLPDLSRLQKELDKGSANRSRMIKEMYAAGAAAGEAVALMKIKAVLEVLNKKDNNTP